VRPPNPPTGLHHSRDIGGRLGNPTTHNDVGASRVSGRGREWRRAIALAVGRSPPPARFARYLTIRLKFTSGFEHTRRQGLCPYRGPMRAGLNPGGVGAADQPSISSASLARHSIPFAKSAKFSAAVDLTQRVRVLILSPPEKSSLNSCTEFPFLSTTDAWQDSQRAAGCRVDPRPCPPQIGQRLPSGVHLMSMVRSTAPDKVTMGADSDESRPGIPR
jgi:hypothetical protein